MNADQKSPAISAQTRDPSELLNPGLVAELKRIELKSRRRVDADLMGKYRSAFRGSGLIFSDLREYQPGDEVRNIHWKASVRTGRTYVKSYDEERQLTIALAVDISRSTICGSLKRSDSTSTQDIKSKHLRALEFSALLSVLAQRNQDALGLCLFANKVEEYLAPKRNRSQYQRILFSLLSHRDLPQATDLRPALAWLNQYQRKPALIFVMSDFYSPPFSEDLKRLAMRHDVVLTVLDDPIDHELPKAGLVEFVDAETGERVLLDTSSRSTRKALGEYQEKRYEKLRETCRQLRVDLLFLGDNPVRSLANLMEKRQRRQGR